MSRAKPLLRPIVEAYKAAQPFNESRSDHASFAVVANAWKRMVVAIRACAYDSKVTFGQWRSQDFAPDCHPMTQWRKALDAGYVGQYDPTGAAWFASSAWLGGVVIPAPAPSDPPGLLADAKRIAWSNYHRTQARLSMAMAVTCVDWLREAHDAAREAFEALVPVSRDDESALFRLGLLEPDPQILALLHHALCGTPSLRHVPTEFSPGRRMTWRMSVAEQDAWRALVSEKCGVRS